MTGLLLTALTGVCLFLIGWGMRKPGRICEFPFLIGATFTGFVLPQAVGLTRGDISPPAGIDAAMLMTVLCASMCYLGYVVSDTPLPALRWEFDDDRLLAASAVLSAIGAFFFFLLGRLPEEAGGISGQTTGLPVVYYFFAQMLLYGFAIAVLLFAKLRSKAALAIIFFDCLVLFDWIVIRARRGITIEFVLIVVCAFWFVRRRTVPRWAMLLLLAVGGLAIWGTAAYRVTMYQDQAYGSAIQHEVPWEEILKVDYVDIFLTSSQEESYEFQNCAYCFQITDSFDGGLSYWNEFIYVYVPAQVLGSEFKTSLQFNVPGENTDSYAHPGSTSTGMADSFQAFGWAGCLVFFVIALVMRKLFETAQAGYVAAQLAYMLIVTGSMHTVTHNTKFFVTPWVHMAVFLLPFLLWARKHSAARLPELDSAGSKPNDLSMQMEPAQ